MKEFKNLNMFAYKVTIFMMICFCKDVKLKRKARKKQSFGNKIDKLIEEGWSASD